MSKKMNGAVAGAAVQAPLRKKSKAKKIVLIVVAVLLVLVLAAGIAALVFYNRVAKEIDGETTQAGTLSPEVKTEEVYPEYTGESVVNLLVCGLDYPEEGELPEGVEAEENWAPDMTDLTGGGAKEIGNTDMILYVQYNTETGKMNMLQILRDTYVGPELETGGTGKINGLYLNTPDTANRMDALARCIRYQLGLPVDYYVTIDMDAVKELIDQPPGTIRMYVPMEINDPNDPAAVIPEGWRDMTSTEVEWFLRNRKSSTYNDQGDVMRTQMQRSFYSALFRRFKELTPGDLMMWMRILLFRVNTDMPPLEIGGLAQKALSITGADITFIRPPYSGADYEGQSLVCMVPEETADLLNRYFRPAGESMSVEELDIQTLPVNYIGVSPSNVSTMGELQAAEGASAPAAESGVPAA